jgi:hypothetical protein
MNTPSENFDMTHQEIGDVMGMNRTTVNYVEKAALEKLRLLLEKQGIKASDLLDVK